MAQVDTVDEPRGSRASSARLRAEERLDRPTTLGPYELRSVLGRGGMATVYRARDPRLGREVAVKLLLPHLRRDGVAMRRFLQEARAVAKLRHEGIVAIHDVAPEDADEPYLVVELVGGGSLREVLRRSPPMAPEVAAGLVGGVLEALDHAHGAGIVHRDIKPENVLIDRGDRGSSRVRVKLADFGIAKVMGQTTVTNTGELVGSPAYMAPEQLEGVSGDVRSDVFAVGVMLYECMTGRRPFEGDGAAQVIRKIVAGEFAPADAVLPSIGARWAALVGKALAHDREARFPSARAFLEALRAERARAGLAEAIEFGAWLTDPERTNAAVSKAVEAPLLEAARASVAAGDPIALAADLNRILALFPAHEEALALLLRRARRERLERRVRVAAVVGATVVAALAWQRVRSRPIAPAETERVEPVPTLVAPRPPDRGASTDAGPAIDERALDAAPLPPLYDAAAPRAEEAKVDPRGLARATVIDRAQVALAGTRVAIVDALQPPFGVSVRVDDGEGVPVTEGATFPLSAGRHTLHFACANDACIPQEMSIGAGEAAPHLRVALRIRPARLRVLAAPDRHFQILEVPQLDLRLGEDTEVPLRGSRATVHVVDLATGKTTAAQLTAGVVTTVSPE